MYRFSGYPSSTELRKLIQTGEADIEKEGELISTAQVTNAFGQVVSRVAFMKALEVGRSAQGLRTRLRSKSAGPSLKMKEVKKDAALAFLGGDRWIACRLAARPNARHA